MFLNYLKISWRNIVKNKGYSFNNIIGLTIGIASTIFILLWVQDEFNWNTSQPNHQHIYELMVNRNFNGIINTDNAVQFPLAAAIKQNFPEVKRVTLDDGGSDHVLSFNNIIFKKKGYTTSANYFDLFKWTFIKGNATTALQDPKNIVLTESAARALFGTTDALDKVLKEDNHELKKVSAIIKDIPFNSTIKFDFIQAIDYSHDFVKQIMNDWINSGQEIYIETNDDVNTERLAKKISEMDNDHNHQNGSFFLFPMDKWRLYGEFKDGKNTGGLIDYVRLFTIIAVIILIIACVNFMNLSTAKSEKRAKEVGIRKTLGSERKHLLLQFYIESFIFSFFSYILSLAAVYLLLPSFNALLKANIKLNILQPAFITGSIFIVLLTTIISGSYPAIYLSSFNPVKVLKGTFLPGKSAIMPRKILVVMQFVISIFLISSTILIYKQIEHVKNRDLGYNPNNLITIPSSPDADRNANVIKNELLGSQMVASVSRSDAPVTDIWNFSPAPDWNGKPAGSNIVVSAMRTDANIAQVLGVKVIMGRDFNNTAADSSSLILNKAAVDMMQIKDPIGMEMRYFGKKLTVVGVTNNMVMANPYEPVKPMMVFFNNKNSNFYFLRLKDGIPPQKAIAAIGSIFKKYNPSFPFEYKFINEEFNTKFITEDLISKLTNIFAGLAIFICCLGLSGLSAYTVEKRFKEIGIRKVLGASVKQVLYMISKEFVILVGLSFMITAPLAWWLLHNWLQHYAYHIDINAWLLLVSGIIVMVLTVLTVGINSLNAALANPGRSLRSE